MLRGNLERGGFGKRVVGRRGVEKVRCLSPAQCLNWIGNDICYMIELGWNWVRNQCLPEGYWAPGRAKVTNLGIRYQCRYYFVQLALTEAELGVQEGFGIGIELDF